MTLDMSLVGGKIVTPMGIVDANIGIDNGRIELLSKGKIIQNVDKKMDVSGKIILPGMVDMHVHFRDLGLTHKEDFETGSEAAAAGGVTTIADMPNTRPPPISAKKFLEKRKIVEKKSVVDFCLWAGGSEIDEFKALADCGAIGFKVYQTGVQEAKGAAYFSELFVTDEGAILNIFERAKEVGLPVAVHLDNPSIRDRVKDKMKKEGRNDAFAYMEYLLCDLAYEIATHNVIKLAIESNVKLHICHVMSRKTLKYVRKARSKGFPLTCAMTLYELDFRDLERLGPYAIPFARRKEDNEFFMRELSSGTVDILETDHSPHTKEEKEMGWKDIWQTPTGMPSIQFSLPLMLNEVNRGNISLSRLAQVYSENPSRVLGLFPRKGCIQVGADADLVVVDLKKEMTICCENMYSKVGWIAFEGRKVKGVPEMALIRGELVMERGCVLKRAGYGRFLSSKEANRNSYESPCGL